MLFHIYQNKEELGERLAGWICDLINSTLSKQEYFTLVLSGGDTPKILFNNLVSSRYKQKVNWNKVHIFWGDERAVPFDERNNAKMAYDLLLDHIDIPSSQVHVMRTDIEPVIAAKEYEKMLREYFNNTGKSFDLVLLGLGDDGHTLSLFPGTSLLDKNDENWVDQVYNEKQQMYRITLMPVIVNRASQIAFMVNGNSKSKILKKVIEGERNSAELPAQIIDPIDGNLHWFLDEAAAKELSVSPT